MDSGDIVGACIVGLMLAAVLAIIVYAMYLMTEGVEGIGRRLYVMLLLILSALGAGVLIGAPMLLVVVAIYAGLRVVAAAAGIIPYAILLVIVMAVVRTVPRRDPRDSWSTSYLEWIKRVAQGKKGQVEQRTRPTQGEKGSGVDREVRLLPSLAELKRRLEEQRRADAGD